MPERAGPPSGVVPSKIWLRSATTRPLRARTSMPTSCWRGTKSWIGMPILERRGTPRACNASGSCTPVSVRNDTSTMASSPKGLNSARNCCAPRTVVPAAKYHSSAARRAHGSDATSPPAATSCATTA